MVGALHCSLADLWCCIHNPRNIDDQQGKQTSPRKDCTENPRICIDSGRSYHRELRRISIGSYAITVIVCQIIDSLENMIRMVSNKNQSKVNVELNE